jgi:hypothetical protein
MFNAFLEIEGIEGEILDDRHRDRRRFSHTAMA